MGETYFFRDPAAFEALEKRIVPALVEQRRGRAKRLRIWSAGCCTGEEPYSIAITLRRAMPDLDDWQVTILATDINPRSLHKAMAGVYGEWSFRGVPEEMRTAWFRRTANGQYEVLPAIRKRVTFECLNLVEDTYPSLATQTNAMDLIVCRNVLMYFAPEQVLKVVGNFRRALVEGGQLLVSATEGSREWFEGFTPVRAAGVALYQMRNAECGMRNEEAPVPMRNAEGETLPTRKAELGTRKKAEPLRKVESGTPKADAQEAERARRLANEGRLGEALEACDRALAGDRLVAGHHYLRSVILQEQDRKEEAVEALKRALYLDPEFVIAHFALGHLRLRQGSSREAARSFANARRLLGTYTAEAALPAADGMTAGRLLQILSTTEQALA